MLVIGMLWELERGWISFWIEQDLSRFWCGLTRLFQLSLGSILPGSRQFVGRPDQSTQGYLYTKSFGQDGIDLLTQILSNLYFQTKILYFLVSYINTPFWENYYFGQHLCIYF